DQKSERQGQHEQGFEKKPVAWAKAGLLADQAIESETERKPKGDPGKALIPQGQVGDPQRRQRDSNPLQAAEPFAKKNQGDQDIDQGIEIVAEADLQQTARKDGDDEDQPVEGDEESGATQRQEGAPIAKG